MSNHNGNNKIIESRNVKWKQIINLANRPYISDSSQEKVQHIGHVLILLGFVYTSRGPCRPLLRLKLALVPRPGHRGLKLLRSGPRERTGVLTLLVQVVTVERLVQLPLPSVINRLLASHVTHIPVHLQFYPMQAIGDGPQRRYLLLRRRWRICSWLLVLLWLLGHLALRLRMPGVQYFSMKALLIGGWVTLLGVTGTP